MNWEDALKQLEEAPPLDPAERARYCATIRTEIERLNIAGRTIARGIGDVVAAARGEEPLSRREAREALVWMRGTSLSFRVQPEDRQWAEEIHTACEKPGRSLVLRRVDDASLEAAHEAVAGMRKGLAAKMLVRLSRPDAMPRTGDVMVNDVVARNIGGFDGVSPIVTFGVRGPVAVVEVTEEPEPAPDAKPPLVTMTTLADGGHCPHDGVTVVLEERGPVARCDACGLDLDVQLAGSPPPDGYSVCVPLGGTSHSAIESLKKKLAALSFMPSLRGQEQEEALIVADNGTRFFVLSRILMSAKRLGLVESLP